MVADRQLDGNSGGHLGQEYVHDGRFRGAEEFSGDPDQAHHDQYYPSKMRKLSQTQSIEISASQANCLRNCEDELAAVQGQEDEPQQSSLVSSRYNSQEMADGGEDAHRP